MCRTTGVGTTTKARTIAPLNEDDELALSQLVHDIRLDEGQSSDEDDAAGSYVPLAARRCRADPRIQQPAPVSVGRRRPRPTKCMPVPITPQTPALIRTLAIWCSVALLLPLMNAAPAGAALIALVCSVRYAHAIRVLVIVLSRCVTKLRRPPVGPVLQWELWAPKRGRRAFIAMLCVSVIILPVDIALRVLIDFVRA